MAKKNVSKAESRTGKVAVNPVVEEVPVEKVVEKVAAPVVEPVSNEVVVQTLLYLLIRYLNSLPVVSLVHCNFAQEVM